MNIVMLGGPGAGKGTISDILVKELNIPHVSTGDMLREEIKKETELGLEVKKIIDEGKLVSTEIVTKLLENKLGSSDCENGVILDGYPRTKEQAEILDNVLEALGKKVDVAINIDVSDEIIIDRILNRVTCSNKDCGAIYNLKAIKPIKEGICDKCGSELTSRADDNRETIQNRLDVYHSEAKEILEYYENQGKLNSIRPTETTVPTETIEKIKVILSNL